MHFLVYLIIGLLTLFLPSILNAQSETNSLQNQNGPAPCEQIDPSNQTNDTRYKNCFSLPDDEFYGRARVEFALQNIDINGLLKDADKTTRKSILRTLKNLFVENTDVAHFILSATSVDQDRGSISLGHMKLFSIRKLGNKEYAVTKEDRFGPLPVRFLAGPSTQIKFELTVVAERQVTSNVAQLLNDISKFAGVSLPFVISEELTNSQKQFVDIDKKLSTILSSKQRISNPVWINFDPDNIQAYKTKFVFGKFLPETVNLNLRISSSFEQSIFPQIANDSRNDAQLGGFRPDQFRNTPFLGQRLTNHILSNLKLQDYNALKQNTDPKTFLDACRKLDHYLSTGPLALTSTDQLRVSWAHMSENSLLKNIEVRKDYCLASKEETFRSLGLDLPELQQSRLPDGYSLILNNARTEAEKARAIVAEAIVKRDEGITASEIALIEERERTGSRPARPDPAWAEGKYLVQPMGVWVFSGPYLAEGETVVGQAVDLLEHRKGNRYYGEVLTIDNRLILHGLGQYSSESSTDNLGFATFTGRFETNLGTGNAEIRFHSDEKYQRYLGQVSREKANGYGIWTKPDGTRYYARAIDGELSGPAVKEDSIGNRIPGRFINHSTFRALDE